MDIESTRPVFEEQAFAQRFEKSIKKVGTGCMTFMSVDCPTQEEFLTRNDRGHYLDNTLNAMWWAWTAALEFYQL